MKDANNGAFPTEHVLREAVFSFTITFQPNDEGAFIVCLCVKFWRHFCNRLLYQIALIIISSALAYEISLTESSKNI